MNYHYNVFFVLYGIFLILNSLFLIVYPTTKEYNNINSKSIFFFNILYIVFSAFILFLCIKNYIITSNFFFITLSNKILSCCNIFYINIIDITIDSMYIFYSYSIAISTLLFCIGIIHDIYFCCIKPIQQIENSSYIIIGNVRKTTLEDTDEECSICIEKYKLEEQVHIFNCNHKVHLYCSKDLIIHKHIRCPLCRIEIIE
jgi:hypothetical protein